MSRKDVEDQQTEELAVMPPALRERFEAWFQQVPEADSDEATLRIVELIFAAETAEDLDAPWRGEGMRAYVGRVIRVQSIRRLPSDFTGGPGWYLGCQVVLEATGEVDFATTGSIAIMAQLVAAHLKGLLPIDCVPRLAERKSRNGYFPMHLEVVRR